MPRLFDAHLHIVDPRFPLFPNEGFVPGPFTVADYLAWARALGVEGGAVVAGSFQGADPAFLLAALDALGPAFVGVMPLPPGVPDDRILALDAAGVRAVRFNLRRGGPATLAGIDALARRAHALAGWHAEVYVDGRDLPGLAPTLAALPAVVIDHLGLSRAGLPALLRLAEGGAYVKATGFGRLDFDPRPALRDVAAANPGALLFGTDLPSTRTPRPFQEGDLALIREALDPDLAERALYANAVGLYRPRGL